MNFLNELKRRNVIRMAGLYLVGAWLITQVAGTVLPMFGAPEWMARSVVVLLAIGFLPALMFAWVFELTPEGLKRDEEVPAEQSIAPQTARRMDRMIILVLMLALAYFAFDKFVLRTETGSASMSESASGSTGKAGENDSDPVSVHPKSIAVLAFASMSADKENEFFSDGVAEEILNALAKIDDMKVAGRTSSFYFKGRNESLSVIGSTLGVAYVLEGSVRKQGERLRINAKLLRVSDGLEMWSESFDGTDADIFSLQESIARQVASELKATLNAGQQNRLVDVGTTNPDAYALYLRGSEVFNKRDYQRYEQAIEAMRKALSLDPGFARAHSRLAALHYVRASNSSAQQYKQSVADAMTHAEAAMRIDPSLGEPHAVLSLLALHQRDYRKARAELVRALELDSNDPTSNLWWALLHCQTGYISHCERLLDRTLQIDPLLPNALNWRARLWVSAGDVEQGQRMIDRAREAGLGWPAAVTLAQIARKRGDKNATRANYVVLYRAVSADLPSESPEVFAEASMGDAQATVRSKRIVDAYLSNPPEPISSVVPIVLMNIGDTERSLQVFAEHRTTNEAAFLGQILGTRLIPQAWASPAFTGFLRETGIAAYWDEFGPPDHCRKDAKGDYRCQ